MEGTSFKNILDKFKQGANSMGEVYSELTYLTTNYDKEIEKLHKQLEDEKTRANNEQYVRHEAEKNLEDLRKLQEINFAVIVDGLIAKPKEEFETKIQQSMKKFVSTIIFITILCIAAIALSFIYLPNLLLSQQPINATSVTSTDNTKIIEAIQKENALLKEFIEKKSIPLPSEEKSMPKVMDNQKPEAVEMKKEEIIDTKPELALDNKEAFLEKVLTTLKSYDAKFTLEGKNNSRILYKMFLLDFAPFKHELIVEELKLFAKPNTYVPTLEEIRIWDEQMLLIYTKMLEKVKTLPNAQVTSELRAFDTYKFNDATLYTGWEYVGEPNMSIKDSLEKEIAKLNAQITLNTK